MLVEGFQVEGFVGKQIYSVSRFGPPKLVVGVTGPVTLIANFPKISWQKLVTSDHAVKFRAACGVYFTSTHEPLIKFCGFPKNKPKTTRSSALSKELL